MEKFPDRRCGKNSLTLSLRVEPELAKEFQHIKAHSNFDVPEAQRIALRDLAKRLRAEVSKNKSAV